MCGSCMESCDFLRLYQQCATPTKVVQEDEAASSNDTSLDVTNGPEPGLGAGNERSKESGSDAEGGSPDTSRGGVSCELARRRKTTLNQSTSSSVQRKAGYFDKNWRSQLCRCSTCTVISINFPHHFEKKHCMILPRYCINQASARFSWRSLIPLQHTRSVLKLSHTLMMLPWLPWEPSTVSSKWRPYTVSWE